MIIPISTKNKKINKREAR